MLREEKIQLLTIAKPIYHLCIAANQENLSKLLATNGSVLICRGRLIKLIS